MRDEVVVGNNFEVRLKMQNQSRHWRGLSVTILLSTAYYTGVNRKQIKRLVQEVDIGPIKSEYFSKRNYKTFIGGGNEVHLVSYLMMMLTHFLISTVIGGNLLDIIVEYRH